LTKGLLYVIITKKKVTTTTGPSKTNEISKFWAMGQGRMSDSFERN